MTSESGTNANVFSFKNNVLQIGIKRFLLLDKGGGGGKILNSSAIITFGNMSQ